MSLALMRFPLVAACLFTLATPLASAAQPMAPSDDYSFNHAKSIVGFTIYAKALFTIKREGQFKDFTGDVSYDPLHPNDTHVDLTVYTSSVDMHNTEHEALLRSNGFFDVAEFPTMHFVSAGTNTRSDGTFEVTGDLTIRGITKRMAIPVKIRPAAGASATSSPVFETTFDIDRTEFGLNGTPTWGGINVSIAKKVQIHIAIAAQPGAKPWAR